MHLAPKQRPPRSVPSGRGFWGMSTSHIQGPRSFRREVAPGVYVVADATARRQTPGDWVITVEYRWDRGDAGSEFDPEGWPALEKLAWRLELRQAAGIPHELFRDELAKWSAILEGL